MLKFRSIFYDPVFFLEVLESKHGMQGKMLVARGEGANTSSKDEESNGLNAVEQPMLERPASVDPLQPNITYREPDVGGYHSRCSSARDYIFGTNEPAQV